MKKVLVISASLRKGSNSDILAKEFYYYEMAGQLKTMLDRANSLYTSDYKFRDIYVLATAAENEKAAAKNAINGIKGWIACFEKAKFKSSVFAGAENPRDVLQNSAALAEAYKKGFKV